MDHQGSEQFDLPARRSSAVLAYKFAGEVFEPGPQQASATTLPGQVYAMLGGAWITPSNQEKSCMV